ncbi:DUF6053 domain-containing protein [Lysobacter enzymogenes]|uniref:DUF6053 domain-containing protein n=1 Tax=Lysobacter enzymogenes TaxID=69 RepID=UPI003D2F76AB
MVQDDQDRADQGQDQAGDVSGIAHHGDRKVHGLGSSIPAAACKVCTGAGGSLPREAGPLLWEGLQPRRFLFRSYAASGSKSVGPEGPPTGAHRHTAEG